MKGNKNITLLSIILFVVMTTYTLILFISVDYKGANFWIGYTFTIIAFLFQILTYVLTFNKNAKLKDMFLGLPIETTGVSYLFIQLILSLLIVYIPQFNKTLAIVLSIIVIAGFIVILVSSVMARDVIVEVDKKVEKKIFYIKSLLSDIEIQRIKINDPELRKRLKSFEEIIKYSDPMSHDSLATIENEIEAKVAQLPEMINSGNMEHLEKFIEEIEILFGERNKKCKLLK